jgi:adenylate kinase
VIQNRIDVYNAETAPVANFYKKAGKFKSINGLGSVEDITGRLVAEIG